MNALLEKRLTVGMLLCTLIASVFFGIEGFGLLSEFREKGMTVAMLEQALFLAVTLFLIYGNVVYQLARIGHFHRRAHHHAASESELREFLYAEQTPSVVMLVPCYREERRIVRQTLLSAALQECPRKRVVLLIDDPQHPRTKQDSQTLEASRRLPLELSVLLGAPARRMKQAEREMEERVGNGGLEIKAEAKHLASLHKEVSDWFCDQARETALEDHTDRFYMEEILLRPARQHLLASRHFEKVAAGARQATEGEILRDYRRLSCLFDVKLASFERKRYWNLSHESNKAMNLNSYIGLIGKGWREEKAGEHLHLVEAGPETATMVVPNVDYVLTLDADSLLLPGYAARLMREMESEAFRRCAVIQTPYSAIPGALAPVERIAGATTDIQHIVHQGSTAFGATFWVGANALLRKTALDEICVEHKERGHVVKQYIQDRTVIEDTESTVDLIAIGWTLCNYPARLSYSATPPDFGSLLIQRRRWANGGLIILPKLLRYLFSGTGRLRKIPEGVVRSHYLTSIAGVNFGILILLLFPFEESMRSFWLPLSALPYYVLYARDLSQIGYRRRDLLGVYALNLVLLPVNLGGVLKSIQQGINKKKIPFGRTPKIAGHTATPALYIVLEYGLLAWTTFAFSMDAYHGRWFHAAFSLVNALLFLYGITRFLGWRRSVGDLAAQMRRTSRHWKKRMGGGETRLLPS